MAEFDSAAATSLSALRAKSSQSCRKRSRLLFSGSNNARSALVPLTDRALHKLSVARRIRLDYPVIPADVLAADGGSGAATGDKKKEGGATLTTQILAELRNESLKRLQNGEGGDNVSAGKMGQKTAVEGQIVLHSEANLTSRASATSDAGSGVRLNSYNGVLALPGQTVTAAVNDGTMTDDKSKLTSNTASNEGGILVKKNNSSSSNIPKPKWHAPWHLTTVISSHLGWVRSIGFDPTNDMFATGGADRVIKIFDFAKACVGADDALKITLTGHISPVRGLAFSPRHPYLFSAGEDKMVKCWDLETNQVVRHYHGHLSGVFDLKLHPELDLLVTGGRDAVARVWDMRTKQQVHCLTGHDNTIGAILTKATDPQVITGSYDLTIKLWDLAAGKCMSTLTHHKKSVRALAQPSFENSFLSGAADTLKKWQGRDGRFIKNFTGHKAVVNALAINDDGVVMSAADNGTMNFWDYSSGYCFQQTETIAQPGSLDAENGIYAAEFDLTGTRLITGEADKTIKIWKQDDNASEMTHPLDMVGWRKKCLAEAKQRY